MRVITNINRSKPNPLLKDPTRTTTLRREFMAEVRKRFKLLRGKILRLIVDEDAFGLKPKNRNPIQTNSRVQKAGMQYTKAKQFKRMPLVHSILSKTQDGRGDGLIVNQRWQFLTASEKADAFQGWLAEQTDETIVGEGNKWWERFSEEGYRKGAGRAFDDTRGVPTTEFASGTKSEFLRTAFGQPVSIDKLKILSSRVFSDLAGVTDVVERQLKRVLIDGLAQGKGARALAKDINTSIDGFHKRALTIARTETIRAHAEGQLDALEQLGVKEVGVMVEWSTAGDTRVCPLCQPMEGTVLKLKEARGLIPLHPNCRCSFIPANVGEDRTKGTKVEFTNPSTGKVETQEIKQKRTQAEIESAIRKSIKAEIPKSQRSKRTVAQQKKLSRSPLADVKITKTRPKRS